MCVACIDRRKELFLTNEPLKVLKTSIKYNRVVDAAYMNMY